MATYRRNDVLTLTATLSDGAVCSARVHACNVTSIRMAMKNSLPYMYPAVPVTVAVVVSSRVRKAVA